MTASEENNKLKAQISKLQEDMEIMRIDFENHRKREDSFRQKYMEAKDLNASYQEEIVAFKREMMLHEQMNQTTESVISEKRDKIRKNFMTINELKEDIKKLKEEIKHEKDAHRRIYRSMIYYKITLNKAERTIKQKKNEFNARSFQLAILNVRKKELEQEVKRNTSEIHHLKVENEKISKERHFFAKTAENLEEALRKMKVNLEKESQMNKLHTVEIEQLKKEKQIVENDNKDFMKQLLRTDHSFGVAKEMIKTLRNELEISEQNKEAILKELESKLRQLDEMENVAAQNREEKRNMTKEIANLKSTTAEWQQIKKSQQQKCDAYDAQILQLKEQIQEGRYQYKYLNDKYKDATRQLKCCKEELEQSQYQNNTIKQQMKAQTFQVNSLEEKNEQMDKEIAQLKMEIKNIRSIQIQNEVCCKELSEKLNIVEKEKMAISKAKSEKEIETARFQRECKTLHSEREKLKSTVEEKIKEIKDKDEKIKSDQQDLKRVEKVLQDRMNDIKILKSEIENLRRREEILKSQTQHAEELRTELNSIHRQFLNEKLKSKTMEDELQKPQNIHRWRILEAEDPSRAHLIARNLKYQKDLVKMTEELKIKEQELQDKNDQIAELQQDLKKLEDYKSKGNHAWIHKKELQECKERIKCLMAQVAMYEDLNTKQQSECKKLQDEINTLKYSAYQKKLPPIKESQ